MTHKFSRFLHDIKIYVNAVFIYVYSKLGKVYLRGGLSSILKDLSEDIVPVGGEIYNPFTPVVSPTEGPPTRIDRMFIQTSSGYRSVDNCYYKHPIGMDGPDSNRYCIQKKL